MDSLKFQLIFRWLPGFFSESIDYLKILGNPWINWFLNFPYDNYTANVTGNPCLASFTIEKKTSSK